MKILLLTALTIASANAADYKFMPLDKTDPHYDEYYLAKCEGRKELLKDLENSDSELDIRLYAGFAKEYLDNCQ